MLEGKYFEYHIPKEMPIYINAAVRPKWNEFYKRVSARYHLLQQALEISGERGEDFSAAASRLFSKETADAAIDQMDPWELAEVCESICKTMQPQPDRLNFPNADVVCDTAFLLTKEWEFLRSVGIGGSEAAVITGCTTAYNSPRSVYHLKRHSTVKLDIDKDNSFIFSYGHKLEDFVLENIVKKYHLIRIPETRMFRSKKYPCLIADLDGVLQTQDGTQLFIGEAKTTVGWNRDAWADDKVPSQYEPQCREYMLVLDDPRIQGCYIGCIYGNTPDCFKSKLITRDGPSEEALAAAVTEFWEENLLAGQEPDLCGDPEKDERDIRKYHGHGDPKAEMLSLSDDELYNLLSAAEEINLRKKKLELQVEELERERSSYLIEIKEVLGTHTKAVVTNTAGKSYNVSWSSNDRLSCDFDMLRDLFPEAYADCVIKGAGGSVITAKNEVITIDALKVKYPDAYAETVTKTKGLGVAIKRNEIVNLELLEREYPAAYKELVKVSKFVKSGGDTPDFADLILMQSKYPEAYEATVTAKEIRKMTVTVPKPKASKATGLRKKGRGTL